MTDDAIDKLIILTPTKRTLDRTGDFRSRAKMHEDLAEEVELGLRRYEEELWSDVPEERVFVPVSLHQHVLYRVVDHAKAQSAVT